MRKPFSSQTRFDCQTITEVKLNLKCRDENVPILRGLQHVYSQPQCVMRFWILSAEMSTSIRARSLGIAACLSTVAVAENPHGLVTYELFDRVENSGILDNGCECAPILSHGCDAFTPDTFDSMDDQGVMPRQRTPFTGPIAGRSGVPSAFQGSRGATMIGDFASFNSSFAMPNVPASQIGFAAIPIGGADRRMKMVKIIARFQ